MRKMVKGFRIQSILAFVCIADDGDEGIPAFLGPGDMWMPLVAADPEREQALEEIARKMVRSGKRIRRVRFTTRVEEGEVR